MARPINARAAPPLPRKGWACASVHRVNAELAADRRRSSRIGAFRPAAAVRGAGGGVRRRVHGMAGGRPIRRRDRPRRRGSAGRWRSRPRLRRRGGDERGARADDGRRHARPALARARALHPDRGAGARRTARRRARNRRDERRLDPIARRRCRAHGLGARRPSSRRAKVLYALLLAARARARRARPLPARAARRAGGAPPLRAAIVFDDPNLRWRSYGYIDYRRLVEHADEHGYHAAMAMIPLDAGAAAPADGALFARRRGPAVARLPRQRPRQARAPGPRDRERRAGAGGAGGAPRRALRARSGLRSTA